MSLVQSRREFLRRAVAAGVATPLSGGLLRQAWADPAPAASSDKLRIGVIGCANRAMANLQGVLSEDIVAICDVDQRHLALGAEKAPQAKQYADYRKLLDEADKLKLQAVVVSTPDHTHAIPVVRALAAGLDVYCEKPLAHSVWEVRQMREWAAKQKAVTQMGTQIHAGDNYRRVVEAVQAGTIGPVERVHVWVGGDIHTGIRVAEGTPPAEVDYDLWIGPAPMRPFHPSHFHFDWRYWWDFGGGTLADFGCHFMDLPFWALGLRYPERIEARGEKAHDGENEVPRNMQVDYHFPARGEQPPVHLTWYHGAWKPEGADEYGRRSAVLFEGANGRLVADYSTHQFYTDAEVTPPEPTIPNSIGHHAEWIQACKTRGETTCNFDYSGALTETALLGNVAYRAGSPLQWDAENLQATNCPDAAQYIQREYRAGWSLL